jgi:tetratricopeptide (TPR) repeat protein
VANFNILDAESLKKIELDVLGGAFQCDALRTHDDSSLNKKYYRNAVKYYSALAKILDDKKALLYLAASYFKLKQYENSIQTLTKAIKLFPAEIDDNYIPACFRLRAWAYCLNGNYKESIMDYTQCKEWDSSYHWCYFRGQAHFYYKHYYDAICDFSEVIKRRTFWSAPLFWRVKSYLKLKEYNKAVEDYTTLIEDSHYEFKSRELYLKRGKLLRKLGEFDKAKRDFELANSVHNKF